MSRGPGRVQRTIFALIAAEPEGMWNVKELCCLIYPGCAAPTKSQKVSVAQALRHMRLPGTWRFGQIWPDCRVWLYDERDLGRAASRVGPLVEIEVASAELVPLDEAFPTVTLELYVRGVVRVKESAVGPARVGRHGA